MRKGEGPKGPLRCFQKTKIWPGEVTTGPGQSGYDGEHLGAQQICVWECVANLCVGVCCVVGG